MVTKQLVMIALIIGSIGAFSDGVQAWDEFDEIVVYSDKEITIIKCEMYLFCFHNTDSIMELGSTMFVNKSTLTFQSFWLSSIQSCNDGLLFTSESNVVWLNKSNFELVNVNTEIENNYAAITAYCFGNTVLATDNSIETGSELKVYSLDLNFSHLTQFSGIQKTTYVNQISEFVFTIIHFDGNVSFLDIAEGVHSQLLPSNTGLINSSSNEYYFSSIVNRDILFAINNFGVLQRYKTDGTISASIRINKTSNYLGYCDGWIAMVDENRMIEFYNLTSLDIVNSGIPISSNPYLVKENCDLLLINSETGKITSFNLDYDFTDLWKTSSRATLEIANSWDEVYLECRSHHKNSNWIKLDTEMVEIDTLFSSSWNHSFDSYSIKHQLCHFIDQKLQWNDSKSNHVIMSFQFNITFSITAERIDGLTIQENLTVYEDIEFDSSKLEGERLVLTSAGEIDDFLNNNFYEQDILLVNWTQESIETHAFFQSNCDNNSGYLVNKDLSQNCVDSSTVTEQGTDNENDSKEHNNPVNNSVDNQDKRMEGKDKTSNHDETIQKISLAIFTLSVILVSILFTRTMRK